MIWAWLLMLLPSQKDADGFHHVRLDQVATTAWTHVCTIAPVVYVRTMADGDVHVTLDDGQSRVVAEIIPQVPLPRPTKGQRIKVCGITRFDKRHQWPEIHPVTRWTAAP